MVLNQMVDAKNNTIITANAEEKIAASPPQPVNSQYSTADLSYYYEWQGNWNIQYQVIQEHNDNEQLIKKQRNNWNRDVMDFKNYT